jgi:hypothetical protein
MHQLRATVHDGFSSRPCGVSTGLGFFVFDTHEVKEGRLVRKSAK